MAETIIFETLAGSHIYGTNIATSDKDYKGIMLPSKEDILLQRAIRTRNNASGKAEGVRNGPEDCDREYFALHYFMKLLMDGQTHPVEMLFIPSKFWTVTSPEWEEIVGFRHLLVSKKLKAFVGYAKNQADKYSAKGERYATVEAFVKLLRVSDAKSSLYSCFSHLQELIDKYPKHSRLVNVENAGRLIPHLEVTGRKIDLSANIGYALNCYEWVYKEYGDRAKASSEGVDWKAVMHAIRITEEAVEMLRDGGITFPRPNVGLLLDIRNGKLQYEAVMTYFDLLLADIAKESETSKLPDEPRHDLADFLTDAAYYNVVVTGVNT